MRRDAKSDDCSKVYLLAQTDMSDRQPRLEWVNGPERWEPSIARSLPDLPQGPIPDRGNRAEGIGSGLPAFAERPLFIVDRPISKKPLFEVAYGRRDTLLINERTKVILEGLDPEAFAFAEVETRLHNGEAGPTHWICDVTRVLDAFNLEASEGARITQEDPRRHVISVYRENNVFMRQQVGDGHFFRLMHNPRGIYCDEQARAAIYRQPKLRGVICDFVGMFDA